MTAKRRVEILRHLRAELEARQKYLTFWEQQGPIELYSPPMFMVDVRSDLIVAAKADIAAIMKAIDLLEREGTKGP